MCIITYKMYMPMCPGLILAGQWPMRISPQTLSGGGGIFCSSAPNNGIALLEGMLLHGTSERACISDLHSCPQL